MVGAGVLAVDGHHERQAGGQVADGGQGVGHPRALGQLELELAAPGALAQLGEEADADEHGGYPAPVCGTAEPHRTVSPSLRTACSGGAVRGCASRWPDSRPRASEGMATTPSDSPSRPIVGPDDPRRFTDSGIEIKPLYTEADLPERARASASRASSRTRAGAHREMYRKQLWTMRQYAGYATAKESNERYRYLLSKGGTGLSMAFDLPTQLGLDSDDPRCLGEVGRTGVAIDTIDDMRTAFDRIPLDQVSTSMTINAPGQRCCCCLYELVGEEQGVASEKLRGTTQNDILKEYIARGNYIYPPEGAMRLTTDLFAYCRENVPKWNTVSISGYHFREKGCSAPSRRSRSRWPTGSPTCRPRSTPASPSTTSPRAWPSSSTATTTSSRRSRSSAPPGGCGRTIMRERFGAKNPKSMMLRFHTQTGGVTLTAQQPQNNIVRVALQGFAAVCGGTQSLHTNGYDEALALPTERAAKIALRTQQVIAHESGAADTVDPFAGSYFVEALTDEIESRAQELIAQGRRARRLGQRDRVHHRTRSRRAPGATRSATASARTSSSASTSSSRTTSRSTDLLRVDPQTEREQVDRLTAFKADRDQEARGARLEAIREAARGTRQPAARHQGRAARPRSMGEVCGAMRDVFGEYQPSD